MSYNLRASGSRVAPHEYPNREDALAVIAALAKGEAGTWTELEALSGVPNIYSFVDRAFYVYGYPELEAAAVAKALNAVFLAPRRKAGAAALPEVEPVTSPHVDAYGFTPRSA